jgi:hypothetical protein
MEEDSDIFSIAVDRANPNRLFAGTCGGVYYSPDGGGTWASRRGASGVPSRTYVIARAPRNTRVVFAGTSEGLMQSSDAGITWHRLYRHSVRSIAFDSDKAGRMFVASDAGVLRSEDGGAHFAETNHGILDRSWKEAMNESAPDSAAIANGNSAR